MSSQHELEERLKNTEERLSVVKALSNALGERADIAEAKLQKAEEALAEAKGDLAMAKATLVIGKQRLAQMEEVAAACVGALKEVRREVTESEMNCNHIPDDGSDDCANIDDCILHWILDSIDTAIQRATALLGPEKPAELKCSCKITKSTSVNGGDNIDSSGCAVHDVREAGPEKLPEVK